MELQVALTSLNLFNSYSDDLETSRRERLTTRLYLLILCLILTAVVIYGALSLRTTTITKYLPSERDFEQLSARYPDTINCPCSRVSIAFGEFTLPNITYHEVCSSTFVSQEWIDAVFLAQISLISPRDVRKTFSAFWQSIRSLCTLVKATVSDGFDDFRAKSFLSPTAQARQYLETQAQLTLNFSLQTSLAKLQRDLLMVRQSIKHDRLISGLNTNYRIAPQQNVTAGAVAHSKAIVFPNGCSCLEASGCPQPALVLENNDASNGTEVPGMMFYCEPFDGVLASSLECFYQSSCLSFLHQVLPIPVTPRPLISFGSRFSRTTMVQALVDELMVEQLVDGTRFPQYYSRCDPTYCAYSYSRRFDLLFTVTLVISTFGGLSIVLKFICPLLIKLPSVLRSWWSRRNQRPVNSVPQPVAQNLNLGVRLRALVFQVWNSMVRLNLFATTTQDIEKVHRQRIITRIFIAALLTSLITFSFYQLLTVQTKTITISRPSRAEYDRLYENHSETLRCACQQPFVPYSNFIQISPNFHQVCSSAIISPRWYEHLALYNEESELSWNSYWIAFGSSYFQLLAVFCSLIQITINDTYRVFSANVYTSNVVIPQRTLLAQAQEIINLYINATAAETIRSFTFIRNTTQVNQFLSDTSSNFNVFVDNTGELSVTPGAMGYPDPSTPTAVVGPCSCVVEGPACGYYASIGEVLGERIPITSLLLRCFPIESVLSSTLECWYDQDCMALVRRSYSFVGVSDVINITLLDTNIESRFAINSSIDTIMGGLFLENWTTSSSYDQYYSSCAPISCTYTIQQRFDLFYVVLAVVAVYGGLNAGLRLLIPLLVRIVLLFLRCLRLRSQTVVPTDTSDQGHQDPVSTSSRLATTRNEILQFNLYDNPTSTEHTRHRELLSTRLYVVLVVCFTVVIVFYAGLNERSELRTVLIPSQSSYELLYMKYSDTLQCPCSTVSIVQQDFIPQLEASVHPVCSSAFVTDQWKYYLNGRRGFDPPELSSIDLRRWGLLMFGLLTSLCSMANETLLLSIREYQASRFISNQILPEVVFQAESDAQMQQFQKSTATVLRSVLGFTRAASQGNALMTVFETNWVLQLGQFGIDIPLLTVPVVYNNTNCSCATSSSCWAPAAFYTPEGVQYYTAENIFHGCTPLDSILISSFSCFFSTTCLESFLAAIPLHTDEDYWGGEVYSMVPFYFSSSNPRFRVNDTLETIINGLFIESWSSQISYPQYFNACQPFHCTYLLKHRFDPVFVATTFLGVFGGLSAFVRFIAPHLIGIPETVHSRFHRGPSHSNTRAATNT